MFWNSDRNMITAPSEDISNTRGIIIIKKKRGEGKKQGRKKPSPHPTEPPSDLMHSQTFFSPYNFVGKWIFRFSHFKERKHSNYVIDQIQTSKFQMRIIEETAIRKTLRTAPSDVSSYRLGKRHRSWLMRNLYREQPLCLPPPTSGYRSFQKHFIRQ